MFIICFICFFIFQIFIGRVVELPSGIDPSFLSALPDNLRREVVLEQLRILGIDLRNRQTTEPAATAAATGGEATGATAGTSGTANTATAAAAAAASAIQINPEFLAALPPQIQEEVSH